MKDVTKVLPLAFAGLALIITGCNDTGGSSSGSSSVPGVKPQLSASPRAQAPINDIDDVNDVIRTLASLSQDDINPLTAQPYNLTVDGGEGNTSLAQMTYDETMLRVQSYFLERYSPQPRTQRRAESFGEMCDSGDIAINDTADTLSVDFQNCRINAGDDTSNYIHLSGNLAMTGVDEGDVGYGNYCISDVDATLKANDVWFRSVVNNELESSVFLLADVGLIFNGGCEDGMPTDTFSSTVSGSHFVVGVDDEFFGMYGINISAASTLEKVSSSPNVTFDSSELPGSIKMFTDDDIVVDSNDEYPNSAKFGVKEGNTEVTFTVNNAVYDNTDAVNITVTGAFNCSEDVSWKQLEDGEELSC